MQRDWSYFWEAFRKEYPPGRFGGLVRGGGIHFDFLTSGRTAEGSNEAPEAEVDGPARLPSGIILGFDVSPDPDSRLLLMVWYSMRSLSSRYLFACLGLIFIQLELPGIRTSRRRDRIVIIVLDVTAGFTAVCSFDSISMIT